MTEHDPTDALRGLADRGTSREPGALFDDALAHSRTLTSDPTAPPQSTRRSALNRARYVAAAAVVAAAGIGGAAWLAGSDDDPAEQLTADGSVFCQTMAEPLFADEPDARVYVDPGASTSDIEQVEEALTDLPGLAELNYIDRNETWSRFQDLFRDDDAMLENVRPDELPTSFEVTFENYDGAAKSALRDLAVRMKDLIHDLQPKTDMVSLRLVDFVDLISYQAENLTGFMWEGLVRDRAGRLVEMLIDDEPLERSVRSDSAVILRLASEGHSELSSSELVEAGAASGRLVDLAETRCGLVVDEDFGLGLGGDFGFTTEVTIASLPTTDTSTTDPATTTTSSTGN